MCLRGHARATGAAEFLYGWEEARRRRQKAADGEKGERASNILR